MSDGQAWYRWEGQDLLLSLQIQPRAGRDALVGPHGDHYRVRVAAPPVEGRANEHLLRFLAGEFGVRRAQVSLERGAGGRVKRVRVRSPARFPMAVERP